MFQLHTLQEEPRRQGIFRQSWEAILQEPCKNGYLKCKHQNHSAAVVAWVWHECDTSVTRMWHECYNVHKMWAFSTISSLDFVINRGEFLYFKQVCKKIILWRCDFAFIQNNYYYYYYLPQKNREIVLTNPSKKLFFVNCIFILFKRRKILQIFTVDFSWVSK